MIKKALIALIILTAGISTANAQSYNWGVGLRGGGLSSGITVKGFLDGANALEGTLSFMNGVNVYALYERHMPLIGNGFSFYYGGGANVGAWKKKGDEKFTMGVDAVCGLEYKIPLVPLSIGADYRPCVNFIGHTGIKWYDFGVTARVAF